MTGHDDLDGLIDEDREIAAETGLDLEHFLRLIAALGALPKDFRRVVVLADLEGLSYREIASRIGCPIGTVMSRLNYARTRLRKSLAPYLEAL